MLRSRNSSQPTIPPPLSSPLSFPLFHNLSFSLANFDQSISFLLGDSLLGISLDFSNFTLTFLSKTTNINYVKYLGFLGCQGSPWDSSSSSLSRTRAGKFRQRARATLTKIWGDGPAWVGFSHWCSSANDVKGRTNHSFSTKHNWTASEFQGCQCRVKGHPYMGFNNPSILKGWFQWYFGGNENRGFALEFSLWVNKKICGFV